MGNALKRLPTIEAAEAEAAERKPQVIAVDANWAEFASAFSPR